MNENNSFSKILKPPTRPGKPRKKGIVVVSDYGFPYRATEDYLETAAELVDYIKFAFHPGTVYYTPDYWFRKKIELLHQHNIGTFLGGIPFEMSIKHGVVKEFIKTYSKFGFSAIEIAEDVVQFKTRQERADAIKMARDAGLEVVTELGRKFPDKPLDFEETAESVRQDLKNGAKIITFERGDIALAKKEGSDVLHKLVETFGIEPLLFEVGPGGFPEMAVYMVREFGSGVNFGNIRMEEVSPLEGIRLGLSRSIEYSYFDQKF